VITRSFERDEHFKEKEGQVRILCEDSGAEIYVNVDCLGRELWQPGTGRNFVERKTRTALNLISNFLGLAGGDIYSIFQCAREVLRSTDVNCVITTSEPFVLLKYGSKLVNEFGVPWIADYRDCWSTNKAIRMQGISRFVFSRLEKRWGTQADLITTASLTYKEWLSELFSEKRIDVVYNGYFEEMHSVLGCASHERSRSLRIAYLGTLYDHQPLEEFMECVQQFLRFKELDLAIEFWGTASNFRIKERITKSFEGSGVVPVFHERVSHAMVLNKARECSAVLLLGDPLRPMLYAKVFDYLALGIPILFYMGGQDELTSIVSEVSYAHVCRSARDVVNALETVSADKMICYTNRDYSVVGAYSRRRQTEHLTHLISSLR
jgi:glycosyltransferase involved in cell wall biosynthesis